MDSYLTRINHLWLALILSLASMTAVADLEIDPNWRKYSVNIDYIDIKERLFVASDREFFVPFNTPIYDAQNRPIALANLKLGNRIWLYVEPGSSKAIKWIALR
jgi:hypothetical protein